jgi:acetoacetate decarboxylase
MHLRAPQSLSTSYPPPPWTYRDTTSLHIFCRAHNPPAVNALIPAPFHPTRHDGLFVLYFMKVGQLEEMGPGYSSNESGILVPATHEQGGVRGSIWAGMFVDNDVALSAGREIWGHPKKLGSVTIAQSAGSVGASARQLPYRGDVVVYSVTAKLDSSHPEVAHLLDSLSPRLMRRAIPSPYALTAEAVDVLRLVITDTVVHSELTGSAAVELNDSEDEFMSFGGIEVLGAHLRKSDFVLRHGERLLAHG